MFNRILTFIGSMLSSSSDVSSKRFNGTMCVGTVLIVLLWTSIRAVPMSPEIYNITRMVFWGGTALLGLSVAEKIFNK